MCTFVAAPQAEPTIFEQEYCVCCGMPLIPRTTSQFLYHDEDLTGQAFDPIYIGEIQNQKCPWYKCDCEGSGSIGNDDDLPF